MTWRTNAAARSPDAFARGRVPMLALAGLMLIIAASLAIGQTRSPDDTIIQTSMLGAPSSRSDSGHSRVGAKVSKWWDSMQPFEAKMEAGHWRRADAAGARLRAAWDEIEVEAGKLQTANEWD